MNRNLTSTPLLLLNFLILGSLWLEANSAEKPNILVILTDDQGYADIGVHGLTSVSTPNMDRLAEEGISCTQGYANPICGPSRAALLTGMYQQRFGNDFNPGRSGHAASFYTGLRPEIHTMGERLQRLGYHTGWVGKWHLGSPDNPAFHPTQQGFHEWFDYEKGRKKLPPFKIDRNGDVQTAKQHATLGMAADGAGFIRRNQDQPWFLYYAPHTLHVIIAATEDYRQRVPESVTDKKRREYLASLLMEDDGIGQLLAALKETGQDENTLIFFLSDNGGASNTGAENTPYRGHKTSTLEGGIRVPFFIRWPGKLEAGATYDRPVSEMDILPTALAAAGYPLPHPEAASGNPTESDQIDGVNLLPYLQGKKSGEPHSVLYWRFGDQFALRKGPWKLVAARELENAQGSRLLKYHALNPRKRTWLINLDEDPGETKNLAKKHPEILEDLAAEWSRLNYEMAEPAFAYTGEQRFHPPETEKASRE
ncbi:N-acetylgalactosamine 6-sulfate sulfatase [Planctomycetales bacterium 10988]|nr:N-acetylgalactosamine 6-sulfate sulfatase [Planctomycetales bacterium 10988]